MTNLSAFYPLSGRETINGVNYEWDFINRSLGQLHLSSNGEGLKVVHFKETPEEFKAFIKGRAAILSQNSDKKPLSSAIIKAIEWALDRPLEVDEYEAYTKAWQYVHAEEPRAFLTFCSRLVFDYHALDRELTQTALLAMTRARYSSPASALLHLDMTGSSGAGKNDLVSRVTALLKSEYLELFSTVSPTALQYKTVVRDYDRKTGKVAGAHSDKDFFKGKVVCITEVADAAGFSALKALAETEENAEYTHMATVNGVAIDMTITGARCVIITSVDGVNDTQVKRRFIHGSISEDSVENKETKLNLINKLLKDRKDIRDDPRLSIARAGLDLIYSTKDVVFEPVEDEAWALYDELSALFLEAGYGLTSIKQFFSLCECLALWKRFSRQHTRVETEDVQEAWFLLSTFERETITKTSRNGIAVLKTIKRLCAEYDEIYELNPQLEGMVKRPTRREVVKESDVSQATVYRLINNGSRTGIAGELIELGYVRDVESNGQQAVEITPLGQTVLGDVPSFAYVCAEEFNPSEPILNDDVDLEGLLHSLEILTILTDSQGVEKI